MTVAKDQHFLPQFYLRQFVDPDGPANQEPFVWLFDLREQRWRRRAPKNVASFRHYYATQDEEKRPVNLLEPTFAAVESRGATLIRKLAARQPLTEQERLHFAFFVALLTVRTPQSRELTERTLRRKGQEFIAGMVRRWREHPEEFAASQRAYRAKTGRNCAIEIDDLEKHPPILVPNDAGILGYSMVPSVGLTVRLMEMTWRFYSTAKPDPLIICDHPADFAVPQPIAPESFRGVLTTDAEFHVPLSPHLIFAAHDGGWDPAFGGQLSHEDVARINQRMARRAERFLVSAKPAFAGDDVLSELMATGCGSVAGAVTAPNQGSQPTPKKGAAHRQSLRL